MLSHKANNNQNNGCTPPHQANRINSNKLSTTGRLWLQFFWDQKCMLLIEFIEMSFTTNTAVYCQTLQQLQRTIQNKATAENHQKQNKRKADF